MSEKCLERVPVHMPETLKRELQDLAMLNDRTVGEYSRRVLELHVYGARRLHEQEGPQRADGDRHGSR